MSQGGRSSRQRADAAADLQRAGHLLEAGQHAEALPILQRVGPILELPAVEAAIGDCLFALGRGDEAIAAYQQGLKRFPTSAEVALRLAGRGLELGRFREALPGFRAARAAHRRDPQFLRGFAYAALQSECWDEAAELAAAALDLGEDESSRLVLGLALSAQGKLAEAAAALENGAEPRTRALAARMHALGGNLQRAIALYDEVEPLGGLAASDWAPAAQAAALTGDRGRAERYLAEAERLEPGTSTRLAAANLALLVRDPDRALAALAPLASEPDPADRALALALTARAHRLADRTADAERALAGLPADAPLRARAIAEVERGHLQALAGDFERAEAAFRAALAIDASDAEAQRGLDAAARRLSWKRDVLADAGKQVEAARAEAEAVRRAVAQREDELTRLKRQLAELERERQAAERHARDAEARAEAERQRADAERKAALQAELQARESEAREKTEAVIREAFGGRAAEAPVSLVQALRVAELNYQKALQTDLPGAGVAVLYSGVLERALYLCIVSELERHLDDESRRTRLLQASRKGARGGKPEYIDHFVGAFDREHPLRAPGLGEVARAVRKRGELHLQVVREFLEEARGYPPAFLEALPGFIDDAKQRLRDPIAHGRVLEIDDQTIAAFRRALVQGFEGGRGVLYRLVFPRG